METKTPRIITIGRGGSSEYYHFTPEEDCTWVTQGYLRAEYKETLAHITAGIPVVDLTTMPSDNLITWAYAYPMLGYRPTSELPEQTGCLEYLPDDAFAFLARKLGAKVYNFPVITPEREAAILAWHDRFLADRETRRIEREANKEKEAQEKAEQEKADAEPCCDEPDAPSWGEVKAMSWDGIAEAIDGCTVEPDGKCIHGCPSWPLKMGIV